MGITSAWEVALHARSRTRVVEVGGPDAVEVRTAATDQLSDLLAEPAAVLLTGSCSLALDAIAACIAVGAGDEVIVPAFTFATSASPFLARGAQVRFADADPRTGNVDPEDVLRLVGPRTRAIVVMHYGGVAVDLTPIAPILDGGEIDLVEDAAQGVFADLDGVPLGRLGRFGALSFHHTKNVSTGEGGALVVNRAADVRAAHVAVDKGTNRHRFDQGQVSSYEWSGLGSSWRMPEAAVRLLGPDLVRAAADQAIRHRAWDRYARELVAWADGHGVGLPVVPAGRSHPAHLFFLVLPDHIDRSGFVARCAVAGVQTARHYGSLPSSAFGRTVSHRDDRCPVADRLGRQLVRIPMHADLTDADVDRVLEVVTAAV